MSSGIGFNELIVLFIIGLLILGPERLPRVASQIGRWVGRARRTANQLRYQLEREIALADIESKSNERRKEQSHKPSELKPEPDADLQADAVASEGNSSADDGAASKNAPEESIAGPQSDGPVSDAATSDEAPSDDDRKDR